MRRQKEAEKASEASPESITDETSLTYHSELPKVDLVSEIQVERLRAVRELLTPEKALVAQVITKALVLNYSKVRIAVGKRDSQRCPGEEGREGGREEGWRKEVGEGP